MLVDYVPGSFLFKLLSDFVKQIISNQLSSISESISDNLNKAGTCNFMGFSTWNNFNF